MATFTAQTLIDAINAAALVAPEYCPHAAYTAEVHAILNASTFYAPYGYAPTDCESIEVCTIKGSAEDIQAAASASTARRIALQAMHLDARSEQVHALPAVTTPRHVTFKTSERGSMKVHNLRDRLEKVAATVRSNAAAFGGGLVKAKRSKPAATWSTGAARTVRELLQDNDYAGAYDLAADKCGPMFYSHGKGAFMLLCPMECEELPGLLVAQHEKGHFVAFEPSSGHSVQGLSMAQYKTRARAVEDAAARWSTFAEEKRAQILANAALHKQDQSAARAEWLSQYGINPEDTAARIAAYEAATSEAAPVSSEDTTAHTAAIEAAAVQDVAAVVACAVAGAAIEAASEAAALGEVAEVGATTEDTSAQEVATVAAELATVAEYAGAADSGAPGARGHAASNGHSTTPPAKTHQRVNGKTGNWSANLYTDSLGRAAFVFMDQHGTHDPQYFETGRERMRALQTLASKADTPAPSTQRAPRAYTPQAMEFDLRGITWKIEVSRYWKIDAVAQDKNPDLLSWTAFKRGGRYALQQFTRVPGDNVPRDVAARAAAFFDQCAAADIASTSTPDTAAPILATTATAPAAVATDYTAPRETSAPASAELHNTARDLEPAGGETSTATSERGAFSITITRGEGLSEECGKPVTVASFAAANKVLHAWSETAPKTGGYNKCDFVITWADGGTYDGCYDLKHHSIEPASLTAHMVDLAEFYTGKNCPLHMSADRYTAYMETVDESTRAAYAEVLQTLANMGEYTPKARPVSMDLRAIIESGIPFAGLVGLGVVYCGGMNEDAGAGAIVSAEPCTWAGVRVVVHLEDGRVMHATAANFGETGAATYRLDWKTHGAPYMAQLAAAVAAKKAQTTSAAEIAKQTHAADLVRLAAEFPQLQRAENSHAGGKLAAVNIRTLLKAAFKGVKFSVKSDYNSVAVRWTDGPTDAEVCAVIGRFDIGAADYQTDYFYTESTAFSELFGGVQYLNTYREHSDATAAAALLAIYGEGGPTVQDYRAGRTWREVNHGSNYGPDSYNGDLWQWLGAVRRHMEGDKGAA